MNWKLHLINKISGEILDVWSPDGTPIPRVGELVKVNGDSMTYKVWSVVYDYEHRVVDVMVKKTI